MRKIRQAPDPAVQPLLKFANADGRTKPCAKTPLPSLYNLDIVLKSPGEVTEDLP
jgi:hypothetical protein